MIANPLAHAMAKGARSTRHWIGATVALTLAMGGSMPKARPRWTAVEADR